MKLIFYIELKISPFITVIFWLTLLFNAYFYDFDFISKLKKNSSIFSHHARYITELSLKYFFNVFQIIYKGKFLFSFNRYEFTSIF